MTKVNAGPWETLVRRAGSADMFALSTNKNHPKIPNVMNKFTSSLFAVAFTFAASVSFANTNAVAAEADALNQTVVTMELAVDGTVSMRAMAILPDGQKVTRSTAAANMSQALIAYHSFISNLPYGSKIVRVEFTDQAGNVLFSAQG